MLLRESKKQEVRRLPTRESGAIARCCSTAISHGYIVKRVRGETPTGEGAPHTTCPFHDIEEESRSMQIMKGAGYLGGWCVYILYPGCVHAEHKPSQAGSLQNNVTKSRREKVASPISEH